MLHTGCEGSIPFVSTKQQERRIEMMIIEIAGFIAFWSLLASGWWVPPVYKLGKRIAGR